MVWCSIFFGCLVGGSQVSDYEFCYAAEQMSRARQLMRKSGLYTPAWFTTEHLLNTNRGGLALSYGFTAFSEGESVGIAIRNFRSGFLGPYVRKRYRDEDTYASLDDLFSFGGRGFGLQTWGNQRANPPYKQEWRTVTKDDWKFAEAELSRLYAGYDLQDIVAHYSFSSRPRVDYTEVPMHSPPGPNFYKNAIQHLIQPPLVVDMSARLTLDGIPVVSLERWMSAAGPPPVQQAHLFFVSISVESATRDLMFASHIGLNTKPKTAPVVSSVEEAEEFIKKILEKNTGLQRSRLGKYFKQSVTYELVNIVRVGDVYLMNSQGDGLLTQRTLSAVATVVDPNSEEDTVIKFRLLFTGHVYSRLVLLGEPWQEEAKAQQQTH